MSVKRPYTRRNITIAIAGILITILLVKLISPKPDLIGKINKLREEKKPMFDSLSKQINEENKFHASLRRLIQEKEFDRANNLVDSAMKKNAKNHFLWTYKGMILAAQGNHSAAIEEYNKSISLDGEFPYTLIHRATAYLELKKYKEAISDCKKAAAVNHQFNLNVGKAYEKSKMIDSAVFYYSRYLDDYPDQKEVRQHIEYLTSRKSN